MAQRAEVLNAPNQVDRRRHTRYRLREGLVIHRDDGASFRATTSEISISGLSASTAGALQIGEEVQLTPIVGEKVRAVVRRRVETIYGFEFVEPPEKVLEEIHLLCRGLIPFHGLADAQSSPS